VSTAFSTRLGRADSDEVAVLLLATSSSLLTGRLIVEKFGGRAVQVVVNVWYTVTALSSIVLDPAVKDEGTSNIIESYWNKGAKAVDGTGLFVRVVLEFGFLIGRLRLPRVCQKWDFSRFP
jgi:hypothetical protein